MLGREDRRMVRNFKNEVMYSMDSNIEETLDHINDFIKIMCDDERKHVHNAFNENERVVVAQFGFTPTGQNKHIKSVATLMIDKQENDVALIINGLFNKRLYKHLIDRSVALQNINDEYQDFKNSLN